MNAARATLIFTLTQVKRLFRDKVAMFFTLLFPLIFLFVFGTIFGSDSSVSFNIAVINQSNNDFTTQFIENLDESQAFKISTTDSLDQAREKMSRGEIDSIIETPAGFGELGADQLPHGDLIVYYNEAEPQAGQTLAAVMSGILDEMNIGLTGSQPPLKVITKSAATVSLSQFDYTFAGLLAFTLMSMSIFGLSNQLPSEKKTGALRRIKATPFRPAQVIIGMTLAYLVLTAVSAALMCLVGVLMFNFDMRGNWLELGVFSLIATITLSGFGMLIAAWAKNEQQSAPISQLIAFPMMFLSGVFFPRYLMPEWLQGVTEWIPLTPISDGIRQIATESAHLVDILPQLGLIGIWGLVAYVLAFKLFRWE